MPGHLRDVEKDRLVEEILQLGRNISRRPDTRMPKMRRRPPGKRLPRQYWYIDAFHSSIRASLAPPLFDLCFIYVYSDGTVTARDYAGERPEAPVTADMQINDLRGIRDSLQAYATKLARRHGSN